MLEICNEGIIYIACPANRATGGPELLHQLASKLLKLGFTARMYYFKRTTEDPVHSEYTQYNTVYSDEILDDSKNIFIVPETNTELLYGLKRIRKVIWWLSVDNFFHPTAIGKYKLFIKRMLNVSRKFKFKDGLNVYHFYQSEYARNFLFSKGYKNNVFRLSDYINTRFIENQISNVTEKENNVLYNPLKGFEFTNKIIQSSKELQWIPLQNMTREQMASTLRKSKVYIDFGNHPGKDRIPREAAISGCCVITGKRGAANYFEDVPIPEEFKFQDEDISIPFIVEKIKLCINDYDNQIKNYSYYYDFIYKEESVFNSEINNIFIKIN
jgi:hypothetical protein